MGTLPTTSAEAIAYRNSLQTEYNAQQHALDQLTPGTSTWTAQDAVLTATGNKISLANININNIAIADKANRNSIVSSGTGSVVKVIDLPPSQTDQSSVILASKTASDVADKNYQDSITQILAYQNQGITSGSEYDAAKLSAFDAEESSRLASLNLDLSTSNSLFNDTELVEGNAGGLSPDILSGIDDQYEEELQGNGTITPDDSAPIVVTAQTPPDPRIRIRAQVGQEDQVYGGADGSVMSYLYETNGVFFPFTPSISYAHSANYNTMSPTHANTDYWLYNNTPSVQINIAGQFSAQNQQEAEYLLASMHFFRTVTKMRFGNTDEQRGLPPPILLLSGYGDFMFNDLQVIVTNFSMELNNNVDYIQVTIGNSTAWVPTLTTFNLNVVVQHTPQQQREDFNFDDFAKGTLFSDKKGWI